jgi:hypothetical protein
MEDEKLKILLKKYCNEVSDDGFSKNVKKCLPPRPSFLPYILMSICILTGLTLFVAIQGLDSIVANMSELILSVSQLQMPSVSSLVTYFGILFCAGVVGYTIITN